MLGKTAGGLFWLYRYMERAENTARLIETGQRISLTRATDDDEGDWTSVMQTAGVAAGFHEKHDEVTRDAAIDWMLRDRDNPSSVLATVEMGRSNARLVRTALTTEVWEAMNAGYMAVQEALARKVSERDLPRVLKEIRQRTALVRGATHGTLLRNDVYDFARLGTFIERADNTCRILDVKYYVLLPSALSVGSSLDNVQWEVILRSVSGRGGFRMTHGHQITPRAIAEFLVLDRRMPRSLNFCAGKIRDNLGYLEHDYGTRHPCHEDAEALARRFETQSIDRVFEDGLHEYIEETLGRLGALSRQIEIDYRFVE